MPGPDGRWAVGGGRWAVGGGQCVCVRVGVLLHGLYVRVYLCQTLCIYA